MSEEFTEKDAAKFLFNLVSQHTDEAMVNMHKENGEVAGMKAANLAWQNDPERQNEVCGGFGCYGPPYNSAEIERAEKEAQRASLGYQRWKMTRDFVFRKIVDGL